MAIVRRKNKSAKYLSERADIGGIESTQDLHELARAHGIETSPFDVKALIKHLGIRFVNEPMPNHLSGCLYKEGSNWVIKVNSHHHPRRRRFTMAHELAHYFLHRNRKSNFSDQILFRSDETDPMEREANRFAGELLMPEDEVRLLLKSGENRVEDLAAHFGVSSLAMRVRAKQIGLTGHGL
jgi:Zn-dependent peptidase ImmA (M78 family)